ncbi:cytochrome c oxidase subunit 3 [Winogradskyella sp.]|uniref:cytochrome c oxidase subunit 3 n=1 Tax=Winogradskyella sp. TaxID=1883156 RepID=UPI0025DEBFB4|nr:cytochrome c oxidase subunit 3 [Winogradskyella sp.]
MTTERIDNKNIYYPPGGILIWIIIFIELFTFGIAMIVMVYSSKDEPEVFHNSRLLLNSTIGAVNTLFLIVSGFCMAQSVHFFKQQAISKASLFLKLTILGGLLFLGLKGFEYYDKIEMGYSIGYNSFFSFYWMLTLFHVIHVLVGIVILIMMYLDIRKKGAEASLENIEASAAFWHMCDLIWILLFPVIYLIF